MKENWVCHNCKDTYEQGEKPFYGQDILWFCAHCWESALRERFNPKEVEKRLNKLGSRGRF